VGRLHFEGLPTAVTGVQGRSAEGRCAWLISLHRREWCVVDDDLNQQLERERHRFWMKGLYLLVLLLVLNPLVDGFFDLHSSPWLALLLAWLHLLQENRAWARKLRTVGDLQVGGVRPVHLPGERFWHLLAQLPLVLALPVGLDWWRPAGMEVRAFLMLMLLFWGLVALEIHHVRSLRRLAEDA
jgi:hypothetical protein